ncbi:MAG: hypothetical protein NT015_00835 [Alphaproteobacteria bacterium]|nr:hypothetical protein [Alphaproteobacteria bacterium]
MKRLMIAAFAVLASACAPPAAQNAPNTAEPSLPGVTLPVADQAGNRMEALSQATERWCTGDGVWCAVNDGVGVVVVRGGEQIGSIAVGEPGENSSWDAWPVIVRVGRDDDRALLGVVLTTTQAYSGGGGQASQLILYSVSNGAVNEVTRMPLAASADVRACFDADDEQQRAGACHDQYTFVTRISLDETVAEGAPHIILETAAGSYPGRVTRNSDSLEAAPLTQADLVWAHDETCSYRRTYSQGADGLYAPDQPLPPCTDYLEP